MFQATAASPRALWRVRAAQPAKTVLAATLLAGAAMFAIALPALAQPEPPGPPPPGSYQQPPPGNYQPPPGASQRPPQMSQAEFVGRRVRHLMEADTNHTGRISLSEWMAFRAGKPGADRAREQFETLDLNHDGVLTTDELQVFAAKEYMHRMDRAANTQPPPLGAN